jgi:hypothetical protein
LFQRKSIPVSVIVILPINGWVKILKFSFVSSVSISVAISAKVYDFLISSTASIFSIIISGASFSKLIVIITLADTSHQFPSEIII